MPTALNDAGKPCLGYPSSGRFPHIKHVFAQFPLYPPTLCPTFREWVMTKPEEARVCVEVRDSRTIDKIQIRRCC